MINIYNKSCFNKGIAHLLFYKTANGNMDVPNDYVTSDNFELGEYVEEVRVAYKDKLLRKEQIEKLHSIGLSLIKSEQAWESMYSIVKKYLEDHEGRIPKPIEHTADYVLVGAWIRKQQILFNRLDKDKQERLNKIGIRNNA